MNIASYIDHTLLKPQAVKADIEKLCNEAKEYGFASVCVNPCFVDTAKKCLADSKVKVCSVIAFPFGTHTTDIKVAEAKKVLDLGADEIDMVINVGRLLDGDVDFVTKEISAIAEVCHANNAHLKVIVETCYLDEAHIEMACKAVEDGNADFIKTSTGYGSRGASLEDIALFKKYLKKDTEIKAAGGIRTRADADAYVEAGCSRIGASSGIAIVNGA